MQHTKVSYELTAEEKSEREALRNEYRRSVIANLTGQLEATTIIEPDGSRIKVYFLHKFLHFSLKLHTALCFYFYPQYSAQNRTGSLHNTALFIQKMFISAFFFIYIYKSNKTPSNKFADTL